MSLQTATACLSVCLSVYLYLFVPVHYPIQLLKRVSSRNKAEITSKTSTPLLNSSSRRSDGGGATSCGNNKHKLHRTTRHSVRWGKSNGSQYLRFISSLGGQSIAKLDGSMALYAPPGSTTASPYLTLCPPILISLFPPTYLFPPLPYKSFFVSFSYSQLACLPLPILLPVTHLVSDYRITVIITKVVDKLLVPS